MFLNTDIIIIFFVKTVYGKLYAYQQYYEGEVSISKYYLQEDYLRTFIVNNLLLNALF
jgi:hypothetical protein